MSKPILDTTCGGRMMWFDKNNPLAIYCDNRNIDTVLCDGRRFRISPDIQCDFTNMPFADNSFYLVVFDPPHLTRCTGKSKYKEIYGSLSEIPTATGWQHIKYGGLYDNWRDMLSKGFKECFRVLKPYGTLIFKWNETDIPTKEVLKCTPVKPLFGHISGKRSNTHWITFMKLPEERG